MYLKSISFRRFRNLEEETLYPGEKVNLIIGENGQGKTNLAEAIWLCTGAKSFRGAKQAELPAFGQPYCDVKAEIQTSSRQKVLELSLGEKRAWKMNGVELTKKADFAGNFICVAFSPSHLSLVSGPPEGRRSFLDALICQSNRKYLDCLSKYRLLLLQKNTILRKQMPEEQKNFLLDQYDQLLVQPAVYLFEQRKLYLEKIKLKATDFYEKISGGRENLSIRYLPGAKKQDREGFFSEIKETRETDLKFLSSSKGPHKDDLIFLLNDKNARLFGSQGQKRSIVLALKLEEAEILEEITGESPVMILDDVLSELDLKRQDYLLNHIQKRQIFVTACEEQKNAVLAEGKTFLIEQGKIFEKQKG